MHTSTKLSEVIRDPPRWETSRIATRVARQETTPGRRGFSRLTRVSALRTPETQTTWRRGESGANPSLLCRFSGPELPDPGRVPGSGWGEGSPWRARNSVCYRRSAPPSRESDRRESHESRHRGRGNLDGDPGSSSVLPLDRDFGTLERHPDDEHGHAAKATDSTNA